MKFGARILKTGLAVTLSMYLAILLHLQPGTIAAISAIFAIQPSIYRTYQSIIENIQGNVIGAIIAVVFVLYIGTNPVIIGLAVIIVIAIHLKMKWTNTISLSTVTIIIIMGGAETSNHFLLYAWDRFVLILIGVISAFLVNIIFAPPKYEKKLFYKISSQTEDLSKWVRLLLNHASEHHMLKEELVRHQERRMRIGEYYLLYNEERIYSRSKRATKGRKLVIYRQMIATTNKLLDILKTMHRNEQDYHLLPEDFKAILNEQVDRLMELHERIMLKFSGKTRGDYKEMHNEEASKKQAFLADSFIQIYNDPESNRDQWLIQLPLVALVIDYSEHLKRLDRLIDSFQNHHIDDNKKEIINDDDVKID